MCVESRVHHQYKQIDTESDRYTSRHILGENELRVPSLKFGSREFFEKFGQKCKGEKTYFRHKNNR